MKIAVTLPGNMTTLWSRDLHAVISTTRGYKYNIQVTAMNKMKANHLSDIDWYEISLQWPHKVELRVLRTAFNRIRNRYVSSDLKASTTHHEMMDILMEHFVERVKREAVKFAQVGNSLPDNNDKENNDEDVLSLSESDDSDATEA